MSDEIYTKRLILKSLTLEDAPSMFAYACEPEVSKYTSWAPHQTVEDSLEFIRSVLKRQSCPKDLGPYGIFLRENQDVVIGTIHIEVDKTEMAGELGYALGRKYWRQGLAYEAASLLIEKAFKEKELERVYAIVATENIASKSLIKKLGMTYESTEQCPSYCNGRFPVECYGLSNSYKVQH